LADKLLLLLQNLPTVLVKGGFCDVTEDFYFRVLVALPDDTTFLLLYIRGFPWEIILSRGNVRFFMAMSQQTVDK
jgi:hypothetical protein